MTILLLFRLQYLFLREQLFICSPIGNYETRLQNRTASNIAKATTEQKKKNKSVVNANL